MFTNIFQKKPAIQDKTAETITVSESEQRYRRLFETAQDGILLLNFQTGMIEDVNKFLIDMLGYSREEFLTKHVWEVGLFKNEQEQKENLAILQEKGYVRFENLPLETKNKRPINVEFVANSYEVSGVTVIQCNIRDITERVQAEGKIKWLASYPMLNPRPILEIDRKLGIVFVNPAARNLFPDLDSLKMSHPFVNESEKYFTELGSPEKSYVTRQIEIGGRWYLQELSVVENRLRIYATDISDIKKIEYDLASGKSFADAILSSVDEGVIVCDRKGKINLFNVMAGTLTGYLATEAIGLNYNQVLNLVREKDNSPYGGIVKKVVASNETEKMDRQILLVKKTGGKIPVSGLASPIKDGSGAISNCVIVFRDASKEHDVDKAKTEFVSLASHQMRTPLTAINWYAELLNDTRYGTLDQKQIEFSKEIHNSSKRMTALVNSLLNVSRLELGGFVIKPVALNMVDAAKSNVASQKIQIEGKKLTLKEEYEPNLDPFSADPNLMDVIFQNLLNNAVKYSSEGGTITLKIKKENESLMITVSDTGIGIPKDDQAKIFGKLFRSDNVKTLDPFGTGLGLYIVREIVTNSGGKIWFESEEGKGTSFYITFPLSGMIKKEGEKVIT